MSSVSNHSLAARQASGQASGHGFGTITGVFTPCVLTILGVIMFLRFGFVVGQAGVVGTIAIVLFSNAITLLTTLSLSAIATNTKVEGGGAYFLISRSLGAEFGGAIGLVFFAAQALSVAMYVIGFTEALLTYLPEGISPTLVASLTNVAVFGCVAIGAGWTLKIQFLILASVLVSLLSFYAGAWNAFDLETLARNRGPGFTGGETFWTMFALFFPAVTGIMAGANMSGDLRNPARSIPLGTLTAVFVTGLIYLSEAILIGGCRDREALITNNLVLSDIALMPVLIAAGVFAATISSALGSMMGAPRILQSLARDRLFRTLEPLGVGSGSNSEPRRAILVTFLISQAGILLADLNSIAPLITMAFLVTYGLLNLATFYESITKNPSYRPQFKFCHWTTSLAGAIGCGVVMLLIDWRWAFVSIALFAALHWYLSKIDLSADWGNVNSGLLFERTRKNLLKLEGELYHPKNWRPFVLALSGTGFSRPHLVVFGSWLTSKTGVLTLGQVIPGELDDRHQRRISQERLLHTMIGEHDLNAFPAVVVASDYVSGVEALVQCQGLGRLRPNVVLLGCPLSVDRMKTFGGLLRNLKGLSRSVVVLRRTDDPDDDWQPPSGTVDVWWRGRANGELMVLLAHLLLQNEHWRGRELRLLRVVDNKAGIEEVRKHLDGLLKEARIPGVTKVVVSKDSELAIQTTSRNAAFVFLGMQPPNPGDEEAFFYRTEKLAGGMSRVAFVQSAGGMRLES
ncbi:Amino acid permease [Novipirellula galeiformis]|uniref:Amino acid permease n=1 Tax=Novipirellula galeiformis TaxID=2528004 RepID=A0A5C6C8S4_9BACT|nr:amino acid permease [Novipirellula galeiformis]TWU20485.1 Amino acid permease [Novipirellula galeiformis]